MGGRQRLLPAAEGQPGRDRDRRDQGPRARPDHRQRLARGRRGGPHLRQALHLASARRAGWKGTEPTGTGTGRGLGSSATGKQGGTMDFSARLDELQQHAANAKAAAEGAARESREQLRQRIDQAQVDQNLAAKDAQQKAGEAAAKMDNFQAKVDKRADQFDAKVAASDADWAENDAADAIDYAAWTVDNARLAVLEVRGMRSHDAVTLSSTWAA